MIYQHARGGCGPGRRRRAGPPDQGRPPEPMARESGQRSWKV